MLCVIVRQFRSVSVVVVDKKMPPAKALQHAVEDQIYRILRKARIITNTR